MKAIFLDRDGTINKDVQYLHRIEDFVFLPGVIDGLRLLINSGYTLFIITNQSGIARGYFELNDYIRLNQWMLSTLEEEGIKIQKVYYCPHLPNAPVEAYRMNCNCRKPKTGLFWNAISEYNINLSKSFAIGDRLRDCQICIESDCRGFLIGDNEEADIIETIKQHHYPKIEYETSLLNCAIRICGT